MPEAPRDLGELKTTDWRKVEELADRLADAWKNCDSARAVDLGRYLPPPGDPLRAAALTELVKTDLEIRWRRGQLVGLEFYLDKFPELGTPQTMAPELVYEEYRVRQLYGDKPPLEKYEGRFPEQFPGLKKLLAKQPLPAEPTETLAEGAVSAPTVRPQAPGGMVPIFGDFKFVKRIGSGSFGEVWRAEAPGGIEVAVKMILRPLDHEEAQRELQSLELIKQLRHPFLVATQQFKALEDRLFIVMELAEGSLRDRAKQCRKEGLPGIPLPELLTYFVESAEALDFLHKQHVQHRDVKPENILILQGHAKVADFGLAKMMQSQRLVASATSSGTPAYMAPEVWRGQVSGHSDQYSLACAFAELRLGRRLFDATDMIGIMMSHLEKTPDLTSLGEAEQKVLLKAMAKDPAQRYGSCLEFVRALQRALAPELRKSSPGGNAAPDDDGDGPDTDFGTMALGTGAVRRRESRTALAPDVVPQGWKPARSRRVWAATAAAACVALAALGYILWEHALRPGSFALEAPAAVAVHADDAVTVPLHVRRDRFPGEVKLTLSGLPANVVAEPEEVTIPAGSDADEVKVRAAPAARPGTSEVTLQADGGTAATLQLTVEPLATLPRGFEPVSDQIDTSPVTKKKYYQWIRCTRGGIPVEFRCVPQETEMDPATFYIMKTKVWNDLFAVFAREHPERLDKKTEWREGADLLVKPGTDGLPGEVKHLGVEKRGKYPVFRVKVREAHEFARWLGGSLPTPDQWDHAAGCVAGKSGPFKGAAAFDPKKDDPPEAAVRRAKKGPVEVGAGTRDESGLGCRDMAGNGLEWTRQAYNSRTNEPRPVPVADPADFLVRVRGRSYMDDQDPIRFTDVGLYRSQDTTEREYCHAWPDVSFRVVVEPR